MRRALTLLGMTLLLFALGACDRPSREECDEACARVKDLAKTDFDQRTAELPDELRREGWLSSLPVIDELVKSCSAACMDVGDRELTTCLAGASSADAWKSCLQKK